MGFFEAFLYGAVQGLTEYLPISSSAHLVLLPQFMGTQDPGLAFDVFLHLGTLLATAAYFWKDWIQIFRNFINLERNKIWSMNPIYFLIIGTIPAAAIGYLGKSWIEANSRAPVIQAFFLSFFGVLLWWADRHNSFKSKDRHPLGEPVLSARSALFVGVFQSMALIPGVSRSGVTTTAGLLLGWDRQAALRNSFLLSLPITAGALLHELKDWDRLVASTDGVSPLFTGLISSFLFGAFAIRFMMKTMAKVSLAGFMVYRLALAALILLFLK